MLNGERVRRQEPNAYTAPVLSVSGAAELAGMHAQTLRTYDRLGLVVPARAPGRGRRYSLADVDALRKIQRLSLDGISLEGIRRILELEWQVALLEQTLEELRAGSEASTAAALPPRFFAASADGHVEPLPLGRRPARRTVSSSRALILWPGPRR
ncbi:heat shock protein transcriptional repressor HspR [Salana multivorans]